jgi:hypothetical protein
LVGALTAFVVTFTFDNYTASSRVLFWLMGGLDDRTWSNAWITIGGFVLFGAHGGAAGARTRPADPARRQRAQPRRRRRRARGAGSSGARAD